MSTDGLTGRAAPRGQQQTVSSGESDEWFPVAAVTLAGGQDVGSEARLGRASDAVPRSLRSLNGHFSEDPLRVFRGAVCLKNKGGSPVVQEREIWDKRQVGSCCSCPSKRG